MFEYIEREMQKRTISPYRNIMDPFMQVAMSLVKPIQGVAAIIASILLACLVVPLELLISRPAAAIKHSEDSVEALVTGVFMLLAPVMYAVGLLSRALVTLIEMSQPVNSSAEEINRINDAFVEGLLGGGGPSSH